MEVGVQTKIQAHQAAWAQGNISLRKRVFT